MHDNKMDCGMPEWNDPCNCHDTPNFCPPPKPPFCPQPPVPSVVQGMSLYEAMQDLSNRVNICIDTYNHVMAENYRTLRNLEKQAEENGSYYGPCDIYVEEGYSAEESAAYKIIHKKVVDRRGEPIRLELHFAYNNTTNSKIEQSIDSASKIELADKIFIAQPKTDKGWYGNVIWHGAPLPSDPEASLYSVGFTRSGQMKVYSNSVTADRMISDGIENSMGCSGVLVQNGEITDSAWYENIPDYNIQSSRVLLGQNFTTQEVMIFVTGKENDENKQGMTSLRCAQILKDYGCNLVVEISEGLNAGAMDKGSLLFTPEDKQMPNAYAFWYISRKCHYRNDYERELAELVQNYGACMWQGYLNKENILDLRNDLNTEIEERKNADGVLQENIDKEQARAEEAERVLQENIDKEQQRAEAAEDLLDKAIKAEQARAEGRENEIESNLNTEITRAKEAERVLQENIDKEQARAEAAETLLQQNLDKETAERKAEDSKLSERINTEQERAEAAEALLQSNIEKEETRATEAERVLQANINKEQARAEAAEQTLQTNIDKEVSRATTAEDALRDSLSAEATARINADNELQSKIEQETTERKAADNVLQENITKEETARVSAVNAVQSNLDEEIDNRKAADQALEIRINATITALTTRVTTLETNVKNLQDLTVTLQEQMTALDTTVSSLSNLISTIETALNNVKTDVNNIKIEIAGIKDGSVDLPYIKRVDGTGTGTHHLENLIISGDETVDSLEVLTSCSVPEPTADTNAATKKYVDDKTGAYLPLAGGTMATSETNSATITWDMNNVNIANRAPFISVDCSNWKNSETKYFTIKGTNLGGNEVELFMSKQGLYIENNSKNYSMNMGAAGITLNRETSQDCTISATNNNLRVRGLQAPYFDTDAATKKYVDDKVYNYIDNNLINTIKLWTYPTNYNQEITLTDYGVTADVQNNFKKAAFINVKLPAKTGTDNYASLAVQHNNNGTATSAVGQAKIFANNQNAYADVIITISFDNWTMSINPDWHHMFTNPEKDYDAANKKYVDDKVAAFKNITVISENQNNYNAVLEWDGTSDLTLPENVNFSTPIMLLRLPLYNKQDEDVSTFVPIYASQPVPMLPAKYYSTTTKVGISTGTNIDVQIDDSDGSITLTPIK